MLLFCLSNTYFCYDGSLYQHTHGTAIGASLSVATADLVIEVLEEKVPATFNPARQAFYRYVDDCIRILKQDIPRCLDSPNAQNAHVQFTVEHEKDDVLPSLGVLVRRDEDALAFSVYSAVKTALTEWHGTEEETYTTTRALFLPQ